MSVKITRHLSAADPVLGSVIAAAGRYGLKAEGTHPTFRSLASAIAHQQLNGTAAATILGRFEKLCGDGNGGFPTPDAVLAASETALRGVGFSGAKVAALKDLATKTLAGVVPDGAELVALDDAAIVERLTRVRGIGRWTVEMMLIFQLGRGDVLPVDDFGVRNGFRLAYGLKGLPKPKALAAYGARWAPHRSAAAWYLWRAVDLSREKKLPKPVGRRLRIDVVPMPQPRPAAAKPVATKRARKPAAKAKPRAAR